MPAAFGSKQQVILDFLFELRPVSLMMAKAPSIYAALKT
jgi:hypothetical protein